MPHASPTIFDRQLLRVRQRRARALGAGDFPHRPRRRRSCRAAVAVLRQFELAVDLGTPTDAVRRVLGERQSRDALPPRRRPGRAMDSLRVAADEEALPSPTARSIWWYRRWRCNSSTTCPAR